MRKFKILLWIFIIFLIQTVILAGVHVLEAVPSLVLPYIVCVMLTENEFRTAAITGIVCATAAGALLGREFVIITLYYAYSALAVFATRERHAYIGKPAKAFARTFILSGILEILYSVIMTRMIDINMLLYCALPTAVINACLALIIYPLLRRTMHKEEKKKLLIGELV